MHSWSEGRQGYGGEDNQGKRLGTSLIFSKWQEKVSMEGDMEQGPEGVGCELRWQWGEYARKKEHGEMCLARTGP